MKPGTRGGDSSIEMTQNIQGRGDRSFHVTPNFGEWAIGNRELAMVRFVPQRTLPLRHIFDRQNLV